MPFTFTGLYQRSWDCPISAPSDGQTRYGNAEASLPVGSHRRTGALIAPAAQPTETRVCHDCWRRPKAMADVAVERLAEVITASVMIAILRNNDRFMVQRQVVTYHRNYLTRNGVAIPLMR
jgi:hypothetical protein